MASGVFSSLIIRQVPRNVQSAHKYLNGIKTGEGDGESKEQHGF
jgi:hypothetical protein